MVGCCCCSVDCCCCSSFHSEKWDSNLKKRAMDKFRVENAPPIVYYIPSFVSEEEETSLLDKIYKAPKPKWTQLSGRRLQNWGGLPHPRGMVSEKLPTWLNTIADKIVSLGLFEDKFPNHVLVNEYLAGQGIMPHLDGPLFYPTITTVTLGSHTVLDFYQPLDEATGGEIECGDSKTNPSSYESRYMMSILLQPRSLVAFKEDMYKVYLHGIQERTTDSMTEHIIIPDESSKISIQDKLERKTRVSLTIRHVPKVLKVKLGLAR